MDNSFDYDDAVKINTSRIEWLKKLNIDYKNKNVLETGVGARGDFTTFLENSGAKLFLIEARQENIDEHIRRFPHRKDNFYCINMNEHYYLDKLPVRKFDIIVCLGTLYHLSNPEESLREMCCNANMLILETQISNSGNFNNDGNWNLCYESKMMMNQSVDGIGCRPDINLLRKILHRYYEVVDETYQPDFIDFQNGTRRCFFCY